MSKKKAENSRIKSVTIMPCFLLKLQGRLDSRKGESIAQAHIDKLKDKCSQFESEEYKSAENVLAGTRANASEALEKLRKSRRNEEKVPDKENAKTVYQLREYQRISAEKKRIQAEAEAQ